MTLVLLAYPYRAVTRPLDARGFLVPRPEGLLMTACSWATAGVLYRAWRAKGLSWLLDTAKLLASSPRAWLDRQVLAADPGAAEMPQERATADRGVILTPLADLTGVTRQTSVLAYQFGDGFSNIFTPTQGYFMAGLALIGVGVGDLILNRDSILLTFGL
mgnify:CR=1 FL=1